MRLAPFAPFEPLLLRLSHFGCVSADLAAFEPSWHCFSNFGSVLATLAPQANIEAYLTLCAETAVIEIQDGQWRFTHDKIREGILDQLTLSQRQDQHRQVAEAIEHPARHGAAPARKTADNT